MAALDAAIVNAGHMAPRTAREAAQFLAQQGKHSHLHAEHETVCISDADRAQHQPAPRAERYPPISMSGGLADVFKEG
ncbi:hypothetical protein [Streptomyces sp. GbtcB6]|uniref:hypothetical protein n=1 Tax=Streptomyces sp. GbtcB6 TaxID=2824751 RepID=UPI001C30C781|nr:hypothetical protein [Streptomyces sp. GbtcB6]